MAIAFQSLDSSSSRIIAKGRRNLHRNAVGVVADICERSTPGVDAIKSSGASSGLTFRKVEGDGQGGNWQALAFYADLGEADLRY